jgi:hypothetical protein
MSNTLPQPNRGRVGPLHHVLAPSRLILCLIVVLLNAGCNTSARAQPMPTVPPQPTLDKTMDAVVRGLITVTRPTATQAIAVRGTAEPGFSSARPVEPRVNSAVETPQRSVSTVSLATVTSLPRATEPPTPSPVRPSPIKQEVLATTTAAPAAPRPSARPTTGGVSAPGASRDGSMPAPLRGTTGP